MRGPPPARDRGPARAVEQLHLSLGVVGRRPPTRCRRLAAADGHHLPSGSRTVLWWARGWLSAGPGPRFADWSKSSVESSPAGAGSWCPRRDVVRRDVVVVGMARPADPHHAAGRAVEVQRPQDARPPRALARASPASICVNEVQRPGTGRNTSSDWPGRRRSRGRTASTTVRVHHSSVPAPTRGPCPSACRPRCRAAWPGRTPPRSS